MAVDDRLRLIGFEFENACHAYLVARVVPHAERGESNRQNHGLWRSLFLKKRPCNVTPTTSLYVQLTSRWDCGKRRN